MWVKEHLLLQGHVDGLVQNCSNSIANALELLQSCAKPSMLSVANVILPGITGISTLRPRQMATVL